jgi:hypothetical protein
VRRVNGTVVPLSRPNKPLSEADNTKAEPFDQPKMPGESASAEARRRAAREVIDILHEIATLLVKRPNNSGQTFIPIITCNLEHPSGPPTALLLRLTHRERRESRSTSRKFQQLL